MFPPSLPSFSFSPSSTSTLIPIPLPFVTPTRFISPHVLTPFREQPILRTILSPSPPPRHRKYHLPHEKNARGLKYEGAPS